MGRTLLIGDAQSGWREWLQTHLAGRDLLVFDPAEASHGPPGRVTLERGGRTVAWRFYGSLDPVRAPHLLVAAAAALLREAGDDAVVQGFPPRPSPLGLQLAYALADLIAPSEILVQGPWAARAGWPVGPQAVEREEAFPDVVRKAQRKAQWLKLLEEGESHEVDLAVVAVQGTRLGSGTVVARAELETAGVDALRAELLGRSLLLIAHEEPEDAVVARVLDRFHCERLVCVAPTAYDGLVCAFAREGGEPFGMGRVETIDFDSGLVKARCTAVAPAPVRVLQLGALAIDEDGNERGELRPWQV